MITEHDLQRGLQELAEDPEFRAAARRYYEGLSDALCRARGIYPTPTKNPYACVNADGRESDP